MPTGLKESRRLVIEGELLTLQRTVVEKQIKTSDFVAELIKSCPLETGLLPHNCVYYCSAVGQSGKNTRIFVLELPAGMRRIKYKPVGSKDLGTPKDLDLSWPNTLWFTLCVNEAIESVHAACTKLPLSQAGMKYAELYVLPMPNQYDNGHGAVCVGNLTSDCETVLPERIDSLFSQILASFWNFDLMPDLGDENAPFHTLEEWAQQSALDPEFHTKVLFRKHARMTFDGMLCHLAALV